MHIHTYECIYSQKKKSFCLCLFVYSFLCYSCCNSCPVPVNTCFRPWWITILIVILLFINNQPVVYILCAVCALLNSLFVVVYLFKARPIRRAQWWGYYVVWVLWPEHWDQSYVLPVGTKAQCLKYLVHKTVQHHSNIWLFIDFSSQFTG